MKNYLRLKTLAFFNFGYDCFKIKLFFGIEFTHLIITLSNLNISIRIHLTKRFLKNKMGKTKKAVAYLFLVCFSIINL